MKSYICDPFQVKRLEKKLKRPLTHQERESEVPVKYKEPNGKMMIEWVKKFNFRDFYGE